MQVKTSILKAGLLVAALATGTGVAKADTLTGVLNINSGRQVVDTMSATGITFETLNQDGTTSPIASNGNGYSKGIGTVATTTGSFTNLVTYGQSVSFLNPIKLTETLANPEEIFFTGANRNLGVQFFATSGAALDPNSYMFNGYLQYNGTDTTAGNFTITNLLSGGTNISFTSAAAVAATPEPNSLMLLGTGFVSAAGMLMRRRKMMTA